MLYLDNPARKRTKRKPARRSARPRRTARKRTPPKGFKTWAAYMASIRPNAGKEKKIMARKKRSTRKSYRRRRGAVAVARSSGRRRYRRNPGLGRGIVGTLMQGVTDAALGVAGKAAARAVPQLVGLPQTGAVGIAVQAAVGIVAGTLANKVRPGIGRAVMQGALMGPIESVVKGLNLPIISGALGDEDDLSGYALAGYAEDPSQLGDYAQSYAGLPGESYNSALQQ